MNFINISFLDEDNDITTYLPFLYIDVTDALLFKLFIQPVPIKFNVTSYRIWLTNNSTGITIDTIISRPLDGNLLQYNFSILDGIYYFQVAALHPNCGIYGCINSTSPFISISMLYFPWSYVYYKYLYNYPQILFCRGSITPYAHYDN